MDVTRSAKTSSPSDTLIFWLEYNINAQHTFCSDTSECDSKIYLTANRATCKNPECNSIQPENQPHLSWWCGVWCWSACWLAGCLFISTSLNNNKDFNLYACSSEIKVHSGASLENHQQQQQQQQEPGKKGQHSVTMWGLRFSTKVQQIRMRNGSLLLGNISLSFKQASSGYSRTSASWVLNKFLPFLWRLFE